MQTTIRSAKYALTPRDEAIIEEKLVAPLRLVGEKDHDETMLEVEVEQSPAEGRSATPCRLVANFTVGGTVFHSEAVKPSPESAADRVRGQLEAEVRRSRGRARRLWREGSARIKQMLHIGD